MLTGDVDSQLSDDDQAGRRIERTGVDGGGGILRWARRARGARSGVALHGSGRGPKCRGPGSVAWRNGSPEPRTLEVARTPAKIADHAFGLSLCLEFTWRVRRRTARFLGAILVKPAPGVIASAEASCYSGGVVTPVRYREALMNKSEIAVSVADRIGVG